MKNIGHWKRGNQYWHIKEDGALLINLPEDNHHYNGDVIFFNPNDSPVFYQKGRVKIKKEEWNKVKNDLIERLINF